MRKSISERADLSHEFAKLLLLCTRKKLLLFNDIFDQFAFRREGAPISIQDDRLKRCAPLMLITEKIMQDDRLKSFLKGQRSSDHSQPNATGLIPQVKGGS